jgi:hypothetical protein
MNINLFKGKMVENELTQEQVAKHLDISTATFRRKLYSGSFNNGEIIAMARLFGLAENEILTIFFNEFVS